MDYTKVATGIQEAAENIFLIYAFNSTGKTQLSVAYKNITKKDGEHTGVYYNAYSEDLFVWDNDEENDNKDIKLKVVPSILNKYHPYLLESYKDDDSEELIYLLDAKLKLYQRKYSYKINRYYADDKQEIIDEEKGISSFSFYSLNDKEQKYPIKISRGEERIFVWCFFLALFDRIAIDSEYIFIDDPVSSLDDYNIFITAGEILSLMKQACNDNRKLIVSTHHMGLFSILQDWIRKQENQKVFNPSNEKLIDTIEELNESERVIKEIYLKETLNQNKCSVKFLEIKNGEPTLVGKTRGNLQYHLLLLKELKHAITKSEMTTYHMVMLRQVLECLSSFLGAGHFSYAIDFILPDANQKADIINALSHEKVYRQKIAESNPIDSDLITKIVQEIETTYHFKL